jgi:uncharacterized membrane protein YjjB (DUF3815 family)
MLNGVASFVGGYGFALSSTVLHEPRSRCAGMALAPATFFDADAIGLVALLLGHRLNVPSIATTAPSIIIMVPGVYAFETIVFLNCGQMLAALQTLASCSLSLAQWRWGWRRLAFSAKASDDPENPAALSAHR